MEPPRINLTSDLPNYQRVYRTSATSEAEINKEIQNLLAAVTKFPPAYLLFGTLSYTPPLAQNQVDPAVEEARKLAKENTIKYHEKNKNKYDARFIDSPFEPGDLVIYEEFKYPQIEENYPQFFQAPMK
ncbi:transposon Ty3-I Gag-Pol polyprotein [Trichonephila clavipes]|nr:transposon Ty3-I Gag-Pol polyprotein [Trichonephila clavipes]